MSSVFWGVLLALAVKELYDEIYHRLLHKYYEWRHKKDLEEFELFQEWLEEKKKKLKKRKKNPLSSIIY